MRRCYKVEVGPKSELEKPFKEKATYIRLPLYEVKNGGGGGGQSLPSSHPHDRMMGPSKSWG